MSEPLLRVAVKAIIRNDKGQVLVLREAATYKDGTRPGQYRVPGGRLEAGEYFMDALHREVMEETGLEVAVGQPVHVDEWRPTIHGTVQQIVGIFFLCTLKSQAKPRLGDEHDEARWINLADRTTYPLLPAERAALDVVSEL